MREGGREGGREGESGATWLTLTGTLCTYMIKNTARRTINLILDKKNHRHKNRDE